jgi:hypothetical protein
MTTDQRNRLERLCVPLTDDELAGRNYAPIFMSQQGTAAIRAALADLDAQADELRLLRQLPDMLDDDAISDYRTASGVISTQATRPYEIAQEWRATYGDRT